MMSFIHKLIWLFRRRSKESELRDELQFHLEEEAQERIDDGNWQRTKRDLPPAVNWETLPYWKKKYAPCGSGDSGKS